MYIYIWCLGAGKRGIDNYHTALQLCAKGFSVTIACRNIAKAKSACASIKNQVGPSTCIDYQILSISICYDIFILNAAILLPKVNYLSQFYLLNELIGTATPKEGIKAITLTSTSYRFLSPRIPTRRDHFIKMFSSSDNISGWQSYARSKLAIAILGCYLDQVKGIQAISVHPGAISTSLSNNISPRRGKF
ncbi:unnamed protein product [Thelazia callipaeda]|uniref:SDR family NAD(P)-dependent oxidoreductase n=1 Tax=Thelazia callipaeda TaxID=103827 RepID=A0A0N5D1D6_THECL|nr:unnamed protein product [Thelazia callipaeda]